MNTALSPEQVSLLHAINLPAVLPSTTSRLLGPFSHVTPQRPRLPVPSGSGLHLCPAGSSCLAAESGSLTLRTGSSSPVAPHAASQRRSYGRLRAGERLPETDSHRPSQWRSQAHWASHTHGPRLIPSLPSRPTGWTAHILVAGAAACTGSPSPQKGGQSSLSTPMAGEEECAP